jgi:hypothetical protein
MPNHDVPQKLIEAWLEFHRRKLCQSIDAVFVFTKQGVEIWCLSKNEKNYQKLRRLFEPLKEAYRIEIYATRSSSHKDSDEELAPPPSLSENYELRKYLHDPEVGLRDLFEGKDFNKDVAPPDETLKQRLRLFAERILTWNSRMKQYAVDLTELVQVSQNSGYQVHVSANACEVCIAHTKDLVENLRKLTENLAHAFPKSHQKEAIAGTEPVEDKHLSVTEYAEYLSDMTKQLASRIIKFIYPEQHTVELGDLRQPEIMDSLKKLEATVLNFQKELANLPVAKKSR